MKNRQLGTWMTQKVTLTRGTRKAGKYTSSSPILTVIDRRNVSETDLPLFGHFLGWFVFGVL
jgi:hypothetical protein